MVEKDNQTSPEHVEVPFQRNNKLRQSHNFSQSRLTATPVIEIVEKPHTMEQKADNSTTKASNVPNRTPSLNRGKLLTKKEYKGLQITAVDINDNLTQESSVDVDERLVEPESNDLHSDKSR